MTRIEAPFHPIIYVRGYAMTQGEVEETVATPYMGFNLGATKIRQRWTGELDRYIFESPLVRLMKDHGYRDVYDDGDTIPENERLPARSVVIYRYYDQVSEELGTGDRPDIPVYAKGLGELIKKVRNQVCGDDPEALDAFKVYLVAHSMGGLICRSFLQNPPPGTEDMRPYVDKAFTYATPHDGIDLRVVGNVPGFLSLNSMSNFNRDNMARYLGLPPGSERVNSLDAAFDADRFFCLVGTDHKDYGAALGAARRLVGPMSDGLVRIRNATVRGAPRAFVHRSHSGHYGIVNSEEGYQNLTRFLFGDVRVDALLRVRDITLPPKIEAAKRKGKEIRASYHFEVVVRPRGARYDLSRRTVDEGSAVFRTFDEMCRPEKVDRTEPRHPRLFSTYLSARHRTRSQGALVFSVDLRVLVPDYEIDGFLFFDDHIEGSHLWRDTIHIAADPPGAGEDAWTVRYGLDSRSPGRPGRTKAEVSESPDGNLVFEIPVRSTRKPGIDATLELEVRAWNR
jgi:hypothetical protein